MSKVYTLYTSVDEHVALLLKRLKNFDNVYITKDTVVAKSGYPRQYIRITNLFDKNMYGWGVATTKDLFENKDTYDTLFADLWIRYDWASIDEDKSLDYEPLAEVINNDEQGFYIMDYVDLCRFLRVEPIDFESRSDELMNIDFPQCVRDAVCIEQHADAVVYSEHTKEQFIYNVYQEYGKTLANKFIDELHKNEKMST